MAKALTKAQLLGCSWAGAVRMYGFKLEGGVNGLKRVFANF